MVVEDDAFENAEAYGIQNVESPGEPNRDHQPDAGPVPGTGRDVKQAHKRAHDDHGLPPDNDFHDRQQKEDVQIARRDADTGAV